MRRGRGMNLENSIIDSSFSKFPFFFFEKKIIFSVFYFQLSSLFSLCDLGMVKVDWMFTTGRLLKKIKT